MRDHSVSEFDFNIMSDEDFGQVIIALEIDKELNFDPKKKGEFMKKNAEWRRHRIQKLKHNEGAIQLLREAIW